MPVDGDCKVQFWLIKSILKDFVVKYETTGVGLVLGTDLG